MHEGNNDLSRNPMNEVANFLIKKDLTISRLSKFDDDPTTYSVWKMTFINIIHELNLSKIEELELLTNHLGLVSKKQALSLRASCANNPLNALTRLWERLDERYGAPEMVESAVRQRLSKMTIVGKDNEKLYEYCDILSEIELLKDDPRYSSLLSYFDSSVGINPIVSNLPFHVQRKWVERASRFKQSNDAVYPPFSYFVSFMKDVCRTLNDPSFVFHTESKHDSKYQKSKSVNQVFAKRADVQQTCETELPNEDTNGCSIHSRSSDNLDTFRVFSSKPFSEKKQFLREKGICYKFCKSEKHTAKNCKSNIYCNVCQSSKHTTALHIPERERLEYRSRLDDVSSHGGESTYSANAKCTEICGDCFKGRSCAKVVLVKVFRDRAPENSVLTYAILDDQSNSTLATSELLDSLNVDGQKVDYDLMSCAGLNHLSGRKVKSLKVISMDGYMSFL